MFETYLVRGYVDGPTEEYMKFLCLSLNSIHICVTMLHTMPGVAQHFVNDVKEEVAIIMKNPKEKTTGMVRLTVYVNNLYFFYISYFQ